MCCFAAVFVGPMALCDFAICIGVGGVVDICIVANPFLGLVFELDSWLALFLLLTSSSSTLEGMPLFEFLSA